MITVVTVINVPCLTLFSDKSNSSDPHSFGCRVRIGGKSVKCATMPSRSIRRIKETLGRIFLEELIILAVIIDSFLQAFSVEPHSAACYECNFINHIFLFTIWVKLKCT